MCRIGRWADDYVRIIQLCAQGETVISNLEVRYLDYRIRDTGWRWRPQEHAVHYRQPRYVTRQRERVPAGSCVLDPKCQSGRGILNPPLSFMLSVL
jgi:hypothetical protein